MKLSDKLKAKREELKKQMRGLVEKAEAESRDFNAEERTAFDKHKSDVAALDTRIADATTIEEGERGEEGRTIAGDRRELAEGEVRALLPNQSMRSLLPRSEGPELRTSRWLHGMLTGHWDGAEAERRATLVEGTGSLGGLLVPPAPVSANVARA